MKRLFVISLAVLMTLAVSGQAKEVKKVKESIYIGQAGWVINKCQKLEEQNGFDRFRYNPPKQSQNMEDKGGLKAYRYCLDHNPDEWWRFALDLSPDEVLRWADGAQLRITVEHKGKRLEFTSSEIFFVRHGINEAGEEIKQLQLLQDRPIDVFGSDQWLERGTNGIVCYARFPGTVKIKESEFVSVTEIGDIAVIRQTSSR